MRGWPTIYILDHKGVIRFKGKRGKAMDVAVDSLLAEMDGAKSENAEPSGDGKD